MNSGREPRAYLASLDPHEKLGPVVGEAQAVHDGAGSEGAHVEGCPRFHLGAPKPDAHVLPSCVASSIMILGVDLK